MSKVESGEEDARMQQFEKEKETKNKELGAVVNFLMNQVGLKTHKGILNQHSSVEFFRGVNFHLACLSHEKLIMKMLPSFVADKSLLEIKSI
jgi:hypothetical protein